MTFVRYVITQLLAYGIDMGLFLVAVYLADTGPITANVLAKLAAGAFAFMVHRSFTFRLAESSHNAGQMLRYVTLLGLNVPIATGVLWLMLLAIDWPVAAKFLSDAAVLALNYWLSQRWVFVSRNETEN